MTMSPQLAVAVANSPVDRGFDRLFPWSPGEGQISVFCGIGACDDLFGRYRDVLVCFRYDTVYVRVDVTTVLPAGVAAGTAAVATIPAQSLPVFTTGEGDTVQLSGGPTLTKSFCETNAYHLGAPVRRGSCLMWKTTGMAAEVEDLQKVDADGSRRRRSWLTTMSGGDTAPNLDGEVARMVIDNACLSVTIEESGCTLQGGPLVCWPTPFKPFGSRQDQNGMLTQLQYSPQCASFCLGQEDDINKGFLTLDIHEDIIIELSNAVQITFPVTEPATTSETIYKPVRIFMFGTVFFVSPEAACGLPSPFSPDGARAIVAMGVQAPAVAPPRVLPGIPTPP